MNMANPSVISERHHYYGLEYLRAFFCICIVALHSNILKTVPFDPNLVLTFKPGLSDIIVFNIFFLAVPVFFTISLFLYIHNSYSKENYWIKRLKRLAGAYAFWVTLSIAYKYYKMLGTDKNFYDYFFSSPALIFSTIISGGFSVFFFIFSLIVLSLVMEAILRFSISQSVIFISACFVTSSFSLFIIPIVMEKFGIDFSLYNPLNFTPYIFSALLIYRTKDLHSFSLLLAMGFLWIGSAAIEWHYVNNFVGYAKHIIPPYARASHVFGATFIVLGALAFFNSSPQIISLLSAYSMGIYCIHSFQFTYAFSHVFLGNLLMGSSAFLFVSSLLDSIVITALMRKHKLLREIV